MLTSRANQARITRSLDSAFVTGIIGPRRVGKSTLVQAYIKDKSNCCQINLDFIKEREAIKSHGLRAIIAEHLPNKLGKVKVLVSIDEAQKLPDIFSEVKALYDEFKDKNLIKFIITGSAQLEIHQLSAESLAGRIHLFRMHEFSLQETAKFFGHELAYQSVLDKIITNNLEEIATTVKDLRPYYRILKPILTLQLLWGGLPEALRYEQDDLRIEYLANYLQTYLEKDVRAVSSIDIVTYQKMLDVIAEQTGSLRDDKRLIESIGIARDTFKKYRNYLSATLLYEEIYPFVRNSLKRMIKAPKAYLLNNGLISYMTGVDKIEILEKSGQIGHRFENWFLKELNVAKSKHVRKIDIYYWRSASGIEVDFVLSAKPNIYPFEVTYRTTIDSKKLKNLKTFMKEEGAKVGFFVYQGEFKFDPESNIYFLPAYAIG